MHLVFGRGNITEIEIEAGDIYTEMKSRLFKNHLVKIIRYIKTPHLMDCRENKMLKNQYSIIIIRFDFLPSRSLDLHTFFSIQFL